MSPGYFPSDLYDDLQQLGYESNTLGTLERVDQMEREQMARAAEIAAPPPPAPVVSAPADREDRASNFRPQQPTEVMLPDPASLRPWEQPAQPSGTRAQEAKEQQPSNVVTLPSPESLRPWEPPKQAAAVQTPGEPQGATGFPQPSTMPSPVQEAQAQPAAERPGMRAGRDDPQQIVGQIYSRALQTGGQGFADAVGGLLLSEGGLRGATGDVSIGGSHGPFQFYVKGELPGFQQWLSQREGRPVTIEEAADRARNVDEAADYYVPKMLGFYQQGSQRGLPGTLAIVGGGHNRGAIGGKEEGIYRQGMAEWLGGKRDEIASTIGDVFGRAGGAVQGATQAVASGQPLQAPARAAQAAVADVDQAALDDPDKWALCGPVAAVIAATRRGGDWTVQQAKQIASSMGLWDAGNGMHGLASEVSLLNKMGISANTGAADQARLAQDAQSGNTPIISTPKHYFILTGYDPQTGTFDTTTTGGVLKGGNRRLTLDQIQQLGGGIQGAAYFDNPASPTPGSAAEVGAGAGAPSNAPDSTGPVSGGTQGTAAASPSGVSSAPPPADPVEQFKQTVTSAFGSIGDALSGIVSNLRGPQRQSQADYEAEQPPTGTTYGTPGTTAPATSDVNLARGLAERAPGPEVTGPEYAVEQAGAPAIGGFVASQREQQDREMARLSELTGKPGAGYPTSLQEPGAAPITPAEREELANVREQQALVLGGSGAEPAGGLRRMYHGTGSAFERPEAGRFDPNGLFGPGYYLTSEPRVAGSYAGERSLNTENVLAAIPKREARLEALKKEAANPLPWSPSDSELAQRIAQEEQGLAYLREQAKSGPNIRPVDVPENLRLLDADAPVADDILDDIRYAVDRLDPEAAHEFDGWIERPDSALRAGYDRAQGPPDGADVLAALQNSVGGEKADINAFLSEAGIDGIRYSGGQRIPMLDDAGAPIEHEAVVVFPESLDKIKNALSGTPGGSGPVPLPTQGLAGRAIAGAASGATATYLGDPDADVGTYARNAALGAAAGVAMRGKPGLGLAAQAVPPNAPPGVKKLAQMYGTPATPPARAVNPIETIRRWFVRSWTDRNVDLNKLQEAAEKEIGRPLRADEMVSELTRLNPDPAAATRINEGLKPALQEAGDDLPRLTEYLTARSNVEVAGAKANPNRKFPGGVTLQESRDAVSWIEQQYPHVKSAADKVRGFVDDYRQRFLDSGVWSQKDYDYFTQTYPNYVPTRIVDYLKDPTQAPVGRGGLSVRDRGLRTLSEEGTTRAREDPLASLVRYAHDAEAILRKNDAFNAFVNLADQAPQAVGQFARQVPSSYTATRGERLVTGFVNGERRTYATTSPIAEAVANAPSEAVPGFLRGATTLFRELITRLPMFVAGQVPLDAYSYLVRETSRNGGPTSLPKVLVELMKGYGEAFGGLLSGEFRGDAARFLKEGGGMAGLYQRSLDANAAKVDELTRRSMVEIRSKGDLLSLIRWIGTLEPVQAVGQRVEMAPRVASFRLAERRGANLPEAVMAGRDVTLDFQRGGTLAKTLNGAIPFFNVGWQAAATVPRAIAEHPVGFIASSLALVAGPTLAAEAWNRSDPQRSKDYDDVPDYVKDRGLVWMIPGLKGRDEQGNPRPNYAVLPMRELAPIAILTREAANRALGRDTDGWGSLIGASVSASSPVQANSPSDLFSSLNPLGLNTGLQLATNRDFFRGRDIATQYGDKEASALSKALAERLGVRPSQVEFALRDLGGGAAAATLGASNIVAGQTKDEDRLQNKPVVGGVVRRYLGDAIGGRLEDTKGTAGIRDQPLLDTFKKAGIEVAPPPFDVANPAAVGAKINLTRAEQEAYQQAYRAHLEQYAKPTDNTERLEAIQRQAREVAKLAVLRAIPLDDPRRKVPAVTR